jgi:hypothetical protein
MSDSEGKFDGYEWGDEDRRCANGTWAECIVLGMAFLLGVGVGAVLMALVRGGGA